MGLLGPSFVPPPAQRDLRELVRPRRTLLAERATLCHRVQKVLAGAPSKRASVATEVLGVSGRAMLAALIAGERDPQVLSEWATGQLRNKKLARGQALTGRFTDPPGFILTHRLGRIDALEESIEAFDTKIEADSCPFEPAVAHLDTIPGGGVAVAQVIVSEVGTHRTRFKTPAH